ncbi:MAG: hypothetical protein L6R36_002774 [Xanthoria steineri]|nr:MAG: hypothetical protein L6R36_002774 [Xanthoria steineri]
MDFIYKFRKRNPDGEMDILSDYLAAPASRGHQQPLPSTVDTSRSFPNLSGELTQNNIADSAKVEDLDSELHQQKKEFAQLEYDHDQLVRTHQATIEENQNLKARTAQLENILDRTWRQNNSIKHELQACKDDLFKMQPRSEVPDSDVAKAYKELHVNISRWMEGEISHFEANYGKRHPSRTPPNLFNHRDVLEVKQILSDYPTSGGEYIVRCFIQRTLHSLVLSDDILLLGLDEQETALLQRIEQSMGKTKPPREPESIQSWRSDTLTALARTQELQQKRLDSANRIMDTLFDGVAAYFPIINKTKEGLRGFYDEIIDPAIELASTINTSPNRYVFSPKIETISPFSGHRLTHNQLSTSRVIDIETGKTLKADSPIEQDMKGEIGRNILLLAPALYRHNPGQAPIQLVKETVLVKLHKPLGRRRALTSHRALEGGSSLI